MLANLKTMNYYTVPQLENPMQQGYIMQVKLKTNFHCLVAKNIHLKEICLWQNKCKSNNSNQ